ncbi:tRNA uridine-5-carboxymethylaminomethyl(34) synthesis GTPase MnmE [Parasphingopyxis algicola]|uniref:tRNA uridine-5-carboxymethylaminomethyl(34) synthesis GTPase MnmE n=1 Tax=Parasphingopyxis algicola TaxID=2026624 RepID=UPI0015A11C9D|nr:tRNA uridine-5-carboxymethylaminomethyl(34) synthesis GTPase MnmE [Parasphingopyxis algicola]QLC25646.1 tRNA uridine-5-carboxymethylaminomethyl(34) synthesis GTPase MnmE [Parasphingopyxis algicola]
MALTGDDSATIFALSTAGLPSAIAIIRLSGRRSGAVLEALTGRTFEPRRTSLALLRDPDDGEPIDRALVLWFPGPDTATGEDMAEFHVHGSRAVAAKMLDMLAGMPGLRDAEAGEFTRRAFLSGRMDLSETEGLGDLLAAETESQRRHALAMAEGGLARHIADWRERLVTAEARLEAVLNFSDEGDVDEGDERLALNVARNVHGEILEMLETPPAERLRDGIRVALAGPPNAGKSTLFNALVAREAAIVSPTAGTTRDVIEAPVEIDGLAFVFSDTAGLRDSGHAIEDEGVRRALRTSEQADILLWLGGGDEAPNGDYVVILHPRADEPDRDAKPERAALAISARTGKGMDALRTLLLERARTMLPREDQLALNQRQRQALREAAAALGDAAGGDWILLVETIRQARTALDRLSGRGGVEDMLDALFGRFCIGK